MLFGLKPWDVATFAMALSGLALVAAAASLLPALRAARSSGAGRFARRAGAGVGLIEDAGLKGRLYIRGGA